MVLEAIGGAMLLPFVTVQTRDVRVRDLVRSHTGRVAELIVLRLPDQLKHVRLPATSVAALLKRRVPGLQLSEVPGEIVISRRHAAAVPKPAKCFATVRAIAALAPISAGDAIAAPCDGGVSSATAYDRRNHLAVARRALAPRTYLGPMHLSSVGAVPAGAQLTLRSVAGPVTVERVVTTLQTGRDGGRVFVRDGSGAVLSAPLTLEKAR